MPVVLLIDDDPSLLDVLALPFEDAGYRVETARDGLTGLAAIRKVRPDVVVSDVNMPGLDGFSLCRKLRQEDNHVPILLLTSRDNEIDEALGLEMGADDYLAKPFSTRVLLARVAALLRRNARRAESGVERPHLVGALEIFAGRLEVRYAGSAVVVTVTEFRLVEALTRRPGVVLSREQLLHMVRGDGSVVVDRLVDTYVRRLRRKFEAVDPAFSAIETVVGAGYRWTEMPSGR